MFKILLLLFIFVPIAEIGIFIQVGDRIGLATTLFVVIVTAVIGVNLLKQQGFRSWQNIQNSIAQGQVPAVEMAAAAQLLFAGGLLLTPGFLTDTIGFILMIPQVRRLLANKLISMGSLHVQSSSFESKDGFYSGYHAQTDQNREREQQKNRSGNSRTIEGEFEEK
jgi:UPF0716 protein FxsA